MTAPVIALCDDCGEPRIVKTIHDLTWTIAAEEVTYRLCRACYNETPEPDTGGPDWEDLQG